MLNQSLTAVNIPHCYQVVQTNQDDHKRVTLLTKQSMATLNEQIILLSKQTMAAVNMPLYHP